MQPQKKRDFYLESRNRVGNQLLRLYSRHGHEACVKIAVGGFCAIGVFLMGCVGRDSLRQIFDCLMNEHQPKHEKPTLVCLDGERIS